MEYVVRFALRLRCGLTFISHKFCFPVTPLLHYYLRSFPITL